MAKDKVKKEPLKKRDPYRYYRNVHYGLYSGTWGATLIPIFTIFAFKWNEYFDYVNNTSGSVRLTIGCVAAIVLGVIFALKKAKVEEKQKKEYSMLHYVAFVGILWVFLFLFKVIIEDMFLITSCELAGSVVAYGLNLADKNVVKKVLLYQSARDDILKDRLKEEYKTSKKVDIL